MNSTPSNNLKEQVAKLIWSAELGANTDKSAKAVLNLILDTILARLKHAGEKGNPLSAIMSGDDQAAYDAGVDEVYSLVKITEVVAMLEGMK